MEVSRTGLGPEASLETYFNGLGLGCPCLGLGLGLGGPCFVYRVSRPNSDASVSVLVSATHVSVSVLVSEVPASTTTLIQSPK